MGELVNLRRVRKRLQHEKAGADAQAQRARFGRTKAEKQRDEKRQHDAGELLDQHRLSEDDQ